MIWNWITIATRDLFSFQGAQNKVEIRHCFLMLLERIPVEKKDEIGRWTKAEQLPDVSDKFPQADSLPGFREQLNDQGVQD